MFISRHSALALALLVALPPLASPPRPWARSAGRCGRTATCFTLSVTEVGGVWMGRGHRRRVWRRAATGPRWEDWAFIKSRRRSSAWG